MDLRTNLLRKSLYEESGVNGITDLVDRIKIQISVELLINHIPSDGLFYHRDNVYILYYLFNETVPKWFVKKYPPINNINFYLNNDI